MAHPRCAQTIAIDGPSASGKSAVGSRVAAKLDYLFLDTGSMYRAVTWLAAERGLDMSDDEALTRLATRCEMLVALGAGKQAARISCGGLDVTRHLREPVVEQNVSEVSRVPGVRVAMVDLQRRIAAGRPIVMAGRDIGTVVLPEADLKVYLDAPPEVRGQRRHRELGSPRTPALLQAVLADLRRRDEIDATREASPLRPADDAIILDTGPLELDQVVERVLQLAGCG